MSSIHTGHMQTPFFLPWRSRLAAFGSRTSRVCQQVRAYTLCQLEQSFARWIPTELFPKAVDGPNSRDNDYTRWRTFWCMLWRTTSRPEASGLRACQSMHQKVHALAGPQSAGLRPRGRPPEHAPEGAPASVVIVAAVWAVDGLGKEFGGDPACEGLLQLAEGVSPYLLANPGGTRAEGGQPGAPRQEEGSLHMSSMYTGHGLTSLLTSTHAKGQFDHSPAAGI